MDISRTCLVLGLLSIPLSIALWCIAPELSNTSFANIADENVRLALANAHAERWGLFVGLWAPTFITLAIYFKQVAR